MLQLRLLGVPAWRAEAQPWRPLADKDALLLARLTLEGPQARSPMAHWLWPEVPLPRAHANLRQRLFRLRHQQGELVTHSDVGLRLTEGVRCDVWRDGCADDADLAATLLDGVDAAGPPGSDTGAHEEWLIELRRQWAARRADLLGGLAARHESQGALAAALAATETLLALDPLVEHAWRRLMRLHSLRGDRAAALAAFERCEQVLRDELGVKPAPETLALLHRVESGSAGPQSPASPATTLPASLLNPPRLVGREAEQRAMAAAWQAGSAFVLLGEPGMGKSRLLLACAAEGPARALATARPGDEIVAYGSLVRLLRSMMRTAPAPERLWPDAGVREEMARLLPELGPMPGSPGREASLHRALEQVFQAAPAAGLQAVLFDDLQHADQASRAVLQRSCGLPGLRWGLASRPALGESGAGAWLPAWLASSARLQPVTLAALDDQALHALLDTVQAASQRWPASLPEALARHCGGNPLFVLETLKHLHLQGALSDEAAGSARNAAAAFETLPLPPSVHAVLTQRLAALSERAQNLARVASVAGPEFSVAVAADVMAESPLAVAAPWAELERAQVFRSQPGASVFAHEAVLDAVRSGLPAALLAPLHAAVALSLQKSAAPPQAVARHFAAAGQLAAAAPMALAAAERALQQGRTAEQMALLQQAAAWFEESGDAAAAFAAQVATIPVCMVHQGVGPAAALAQALLARCEGAAQRLALRLEQANVALAAQDLATLHQASAAALADALPGSTQALRALALHATALVFGGDLAQALTRVQQVQQGLPAITDARLAAELQGHVAMVFACCGRTRDCVEALHGQHHHARQAGDLEQEAIALSSMASQHLHLGQVELAVQHAQQAAVLYRRLDSAGTAFANNLNLAMSLIALNHYQAARAVLDEALAHCDRAASSADLRTVVANLRAGLCQRLGDAAGALRELDQAPAPAAPRLKIQQQLLRAHAALMLGQRDTALRHWSTLTPLLSSGGPTTVVTLTARALASQCLDAEAARLELDDVLQAAEQAEFPAAQAAALMAQARRALAAGDAAAAQPLGARLWGMREPARHLHLDQGELCALVCEVADAGRDPQHARQVRAAAVQAFVQAAQAHVPPGEIAAWRAHPLRLALWREGPQPVIRPGDGAG